MVVKKLLAILVFLVLLLLILLNYRSGSSRSFETSIPKASNVSQSRQVDSPDGSMMLIMKRDKDSNGASVYSFTVKDGSGRELPIFEKTVKFGETMDLPQNSWSPNNKYLFIKDNNGYKTDYLVFKADGGSFPAGEKYLNATALFDQKVKNYNLKSMTGWDDPVLISVRTVDGPHFWFDLTTQSFIQLVK